MWENIFQPRGRTARADEEASCPALPGTFAARGEGPGGPVLVVIERTAELLRPGDTDRSLRLWPVAALRRVTTPAPRRAAARSGLRAIVDGGGRGASPRAAAGDKARCGGGQEAATGDKRRAATGGGGSVSPAGRGGTGCRLVAPYCGVRCGALRLAAARCGLGERAFRLTAPYCGLLRLAAAAFVIDCRASPSLQMVQRERRRSNVMVKQSLRTVRLAAAARPCGSSRHILHSGVGPGPL